MTELRLTLVQVPALAVSLAAATPPLALAFSGQGTLDVTLLAERPAINLVLRQPQALDAALLPVLIGPPGTGSGTATPPTTRTLTWAAGKLAAVTYADGSSKTMTYTGEQLTRVDRLTPGQLTQRADLAYNPDGTLAGITESVI